MLAGPARGKRKRRQPLAAVQSPFKRALQWLLMVILGSSALLGLLAFLGWSILRQQLNELTQPISWLVVGRDLEHGPGSPVLLWFSPAENHAYVAVLDPELKLSVWGGYGQYPARSVASLLEQEKKPLSWLKGIYGYQLGWGIEQTGVVGQVPLVSNRAELLQLLQPSTGGGNWSLSWWQRWQWWAWLSQLRDDQVEVTAVHNLEEWDKLRSNWPTERPIQLDHCSIGVVNTTGKQGLATFTSKLLEQSGLPIIRVTDEATVVPQTRILVRPGCTEMSVVVQNFLPVNVEVVELGDAQAQYRADVVVLLGQDLAELIN